MDPVGGAEQGMKVLQEMNSLVDDHGEFVNSKSYSGIGPILGASTKSMGPTLDVVS